MCSFKSSLAYLALVSVLSVGFMCLSAGESAAAVPEKASSQQEAIGAP